MGDTNHKALHPLTHAFQEWPIPPLHKGSSRPGWHAACLLLSVLTLQGKMKHPKKTPNDSQRDLKGLTGNREIQKPENSKKGEEIKWQMGGTVHKML